METGVWRHTWGRKGVNIHIDLGLPVDWTGDRGGCEKDEYQS